MELFERLRKMSAGIGGPWLGKNTDTACVFIVGCPRSGTSALSWALAQHPRLWTSAESDFLAFLFGQGKLRNAYQEAFARPDTGWLRKNHVTFEEFASSIGSGVDRLFRSRSGNRIWVDASPGYTLIADELLPLFPKARFIHLVRDGRAVVTSMMKSGFPAPWAKDFRTACRTWVHYVRKGFEFEARAEDRVLHVRHERIVEDPFSVCEEIQRFLALVPSKAPAAFLSTKRINSSHGNRTVADVRSIKDPQHLKRRPWERWDQRRKTTFKRVAGETMEFLQDKSRESTRESSRPSARHSASEGLASESEDQALGTA